MSELGYGGALLLGVLQGLSEFLPVSSSAHLALAQRWLNLAAESTPLLLFDAITHVGTLLAVGVVFARPLWQFGLRLAAEIQSTDPGPRHAWRIAGLAFIANIPTGFIGLGFKDTLEAAFSKPMWIGVGLLVTGLLLAATALLSRGRRGWKAFPWWQAVLVGTAQGVAILPGISRSGATICTATFCGLRRRWAAEFSFLIAAPAILAATAIKLKDMLGSDGGLSGLAWGPVLVGGAAAFVVGVAALRLLLAAVRRARLHYFTAYCWLLAGLVLAGVV